MELDYLAFGAHPDDVEIGMAGTLIRASHEGKLTGICELTLAELSSNGTPENRQQEAAIAAHIMGVQVRENLGFKDRGLYVTPDHINQVVSIIRKYKPRVVFAPYWQDRHPDHIAASKIVDEAVFSAGIRKYEDSLNLPPHKIEKLYYYFINDYDRPNLVVDISAYQQTKEMALKAYQSQFFYEEQEIKTPLNQGFLEMIKSRDTLFGHQVGVTYAEGFIQKVPHLCMP